MSPHIGELSVVRWRRFGKDRLYVKHPEGADLGWWDLVADEPHPAEPEHVTALTSAVTAWRTEAPPSATPPPVKTLIARALGFHHQERAWRLGADGEEKAAAELAKVAKRDPRWRCLHALPGGRRGSDIDHLVIGPGGIFTINAKNHPEAVIWVRSNTFLVNGQQHPYVRNSRHEAARAARLLTEACAFPVHVEPLIVTVNARLDIKSQPADVHVLGRKSLASWLLRHGDVHTEEMLAAVYEMARRSTTWR